MTYEAHAVDEAEIPLAALFQEVNRLGVVFLGDPVDLQKTSIFEKG